MYAHNPTPGKHCERIAVHATGALAGVHSSRQDYLQPYLLTRSRKLDT